MLIVDAHFNKIESTYGSITLLRFLGVTWEEDQFAAVDLEPLAVDLQRFYRFVSSAMVH